MKQWCVLVVDDEEGLRDMLRNALEGVGYAVRMAADAQEARRALDEGGIDLVLLDAVLPGESGPALGEHVARDRKLPLVFISGDPGALRELRSAPFVRLGKPFRLTQLLHVIDQELRATSRRAESKDKVVGAKAPSSAIVSETPGVLTA
jgi:DNA-binding NtrC family response regulator